MLPDKMDENLKVDLMAGAAGGGVSVFVSHPLDTVKVKMQLYPASFKNMGVCLKQIFNRQGIRGLYCGTIPALTSTCAETAVMFGTYGQCQKIVASKLDVGTDITKLNYLQNAAAGGMASVLTSLVLCPTELVKIRMQADYGVNKKSAAKVIRETFKTDGFKGFLRGLSFTLARESIGNTVFFGTYEWCREFLKPKGQSKEGCSVFATMISGSVAGVANWVAVYPFDVIKSKLQSTTGKVSRKFIWEQIKEQGIRSLYNGLRPTLVKTIPTTGLMLVGVEYSKPWFKKLLCLTQSSNPPDNIKADKEVFSYCDFLSGWTADSRFL
ncbi:mitochondrial ornithine transporter 1-like isoform X1 [Daktulosphaira vitifoliae]|uniref:mitochondrial ornithine transporter 1-like isoform X1 n=1 Tax=Daktulosphaira vitifoliae TaxID=58002 RepID=UPI0021AAFD97|nr:mitochondrial ornithine transporter 1-like isoform X1 [Daktulosphaira vitifoliae]